MDIKDISQDIFGASKSNTSSGVDFKRVFYRLKRFWYWPVATLTVALAIAIINNRYAVRIYPVRASIVIKSQDAQSGQLLYNNPLVSLNRNYFDELYIIRSYPLIEGVIKKLGFESSFYMEGAFLTSEAYDYIPVKAHIVDNGDRSYNRFYFRIINEQQFQLAPNGNHSFSDENAQTFSFGDTVQFSNMKIVFDIRPEKNLERQIGEVFIYTYTEASSLTSAYVSKLNVAWAEMGAGVINLAVNGPHASKEIDFLSGLIAAYQQNDLDQKNSAASRTIDFITDQLKRISDSLRVVELSMERFKGKHVITDLGAETMRIYQKLEALEAQKTQIIVAQSYYQYLEKYIQNAKDLNQVILPSSVGIEDAVLGSLISGMISNQQELKLMEGEGKAQNPLLEKLHARIREIKEDILESVKNQRGVDKIKMAHINDEIQLEEKQLNYLPLAEREYVSIKRNYSLLENLYIYLLQKRAEASISKASTSSSIFVINPPRKSGGPITPKKTQNIAIAAVLGLFIPILVFTIMEYLNVRVQSREDIEKITTIPFMGGVGRKHTKDNLEVLTNPKSSLAESFRALRSNLNYVLSQRTKGVFLVTSSISGEGKSFTSINLASIFALSGKSTVIVGADMRKPKLYDDFHLSNTKGLSSFLAGMASLEEVIQRTENESLYLVSGGPVPPNPSELLLGDRMITFIEALRDKFDYVIIDSPPLAIVTDAFILSEYVDHTLFLVRQNYTPKELLKTINEFYTSGKVKNISLVFNDIYRSGAGYGYGYGYTYGYGYGYGYGFKKKSNDGYYTD